MTHALSKRLTAECLGTLLLLATVVGSGIMAERLAGGNIALALLANTIATGAILVVLITFFGPLSGAHFNPAVTAGFALRREISLGEGALYGVAQIVGGVAGVLLAHGMFDLELFQLSTTVRSGPGQWLSEGVATFGLMFTILATLRASPASVPLAVGLYITAAYWFTASTSFANPAVTIARSLTDTFSGIQPGNVSMFLAMQILGSVVAVGLWRWLDDPDGQRSPI